MPWWGYILFALAVVLAIKGFLALVGVETRWVTRKTSRTAEDLYPDYADSLRKQHRYAREHAGERRNQDDGPGPAQGASS
jgi:hypothetical protein